MSLHIKYKNDLKLLRGALITGYRKINQQPPLENDPVQYYLSSVWLNEGSVLTKERHHLNPQHLGGRTYKISYQLGSQSLNCA